MDIHQTKSEQMKFFFISNTCTTSICGFSLRFCTAALSALMAILHIVLLFTTASESFTALTIYLYALSILWLAAGSVTKLQIHSYLYIMTYVLEITTVIVILVNVGIVFAVWDSLCFIEILCDII
jgi:hypothetical protein